MAERKGVSDKTEHADRHLGQDGPRNPLTHPLEVLGTDTYTVLSWGEKSGGGGRKQECGRGRDSRKIEQEG